MGIKKPMNFVILLALVLSPISLFGAGLTVSTTNGWSTGQRLNIPISTNAIFYPGTPTTPAGTFNASIIPSTNLLVVSGLTTDTAKNGDTAWDSSGFNNKYTNASGNVITFTDDPFNQWVIADGGATFINTNTDPSVGLWQLAFGSSTNVISVVKKSTTAIAVNGDAVITGSTRSGSFQGNIEATTNVGGASPIFSDTKIPDSSLRVSTNHTAPIDAVTPIGWLELLDSDGNSYRSPLYQ